MQALCNRVEGSAVQAARACRMQAVAAGTTYLRIRLDVGEGNRCVLALQRHVLCSGHRGAWPRHVASGGAARVVAGGVTVPAALILLLGPAANAVGQLAPDVAHQRENYSAHFRRGTCGNAAAELSAAKIAASGA